MSYCIIFLGILVKITSTTTSEKINLILDNSQGEKSLRLITSKSINFGFIEGFELVTKEVNLEIHQKDNNRDQLLNADIADQSTEFQIDKNLESDSLQSFQSDNDINKNSNFQLKTMIFLVFSPFLLHFQELYLVCIFL